MAEERIPRLEKTFLCEEVLSADDLNLLALFINNIISYINGLDSLTGPPGRDGENGLDGLRGQNGEDGQDGHSPEINIGEDGYWYIDGVNTGVPANMESGFNYKLGEDPVFLDALERIAELNRKISNLGTGQGSQSSYDINDVVDTVLEALRDWNWNSIIKISGWDPNMLAYLTQIGLLTSADWNLDGTLKTQVRISKILQRLDSIESLLQQYTIITDGNGNSESLESIKTSIALWISDNLALTTMQALIEDWPTNGPTIYSALSETKNTAEKTEAGLQAMYQQYAGVISREHYTNSLIEGLANEQKSRTTLSSAFGDYVFDNDNPVYETYDAPPQNSSSITGLYPVYELDENGNAIPYTGIVIKYIKYENNEGNLVDDPEVANKLTYLSSPLGASNMIKKTAQTDENGNVVKVNDKVVYDITEIKDDNGNIIKARKAFKVYYKVDPSTVEPNSRPYNGQYGNYYNNSNYYFAENILEPELDDQNNPIMTKYLYDANLDTTVDYEHFSDYLSLSYDNDGNITTQSVIVNNNLNDPMYVKFIDNYGPDIIAYHKARKLVIRNTSGLITESNLDGSMYELFSNTGSRTYSTLIGLTTDNLSFIEAVATALGSLSTSAQADAKIIADASMYEAKVLYKHTVNSNEVWDDLPTDEDIFNGATAVSNYSDTRIKMDNNGNIIWVLDSVYILNSGDDHNEYSYKELKKKYPSISSSDVTRYLLYVNPDGTISKNNNISGSVPKKKLIKLATAGVIFTASSEGLVMSNIYSKLEDKYAGLTAIAQKIHEKEISGTNKYFFKYIGTTNNDYTNGKNYWLTSLSPSPSSDWEEAYEIETNVTLSADEINIMGDTFIDRLTSDSAFIDNLTVSKIYSRSKHLNGGYDHLGIDSSKGFRTYFTLNLNDSEPNDDTVSTVSNVIRMDGSGKLAKGKIFWDVNGNLTASNININLEGDDNEDDDNNGSGSGNLTTFRNILIKNSSNTNFIALNPGQGISIYSKTGDNINYIHQIKKDGRLNLCGGKIKWNWNNNDNTLKVVGQIDATTFGVLRPSSSVDYTIEFTTLTQDLWNQYDGIRNAFKQEDIDNVPIGLIYGEKVVNNTSTWVPINFFDFAPVNNGDFSADEESVYIITGATLSQKVKILYHSSIFKVNSDSNSNDLSISGKYYRFPRSNGPLVQITENDNCYLRIQSYSGIVSSGNSYNIIRVTIYQLIIVTNGTKTSRNNYYIVGTDLTGDNLLSYEPSGNYISIDTGSYQGNGNPLIDSNGNSVNTSPNFAIIASNLYGIYIQNIA